MPAHQAAATTAPAARASTPNGVLAFLPWSADNKAAAVALVALIVGVLTLLLAPSDASRVASALSSRRPITMLEIKNYVDRHEVANIIRAIEKGTNFVVVEGGNRMGKTVATKAAVSRMSSNRTVLWYNKMDTMNRALEAMFGLERNNLVNQLFGFVQTFQATQATSVDVQQIVLSLASTKPEPVFVVEQAEQLPVEELKALIDFAK